MARSRILITALVCVSLAVMACAQEVERVTPTPTSLPATPTPTLIPPPTPTSTPTPTPTATPTPTPLSLLLLDVQGPEEGATVQTDAVVVYGATSRGATITVNGNVAFVDRDGRFQTEVTLSPGENTIEVVATSAAGNRVRRVLTVTFQVPSPQAFFLIITEPEDQSIVSSRTIPLTGQTAPGAVVSVNGVGVDVGKQGSFSTVVTLEQGPNIIEVVGTNPDGRVLAAVIAVIFRP